MLFIKASRGTKKKLKETIFWILEITGLETVTWFIIAFKKTNLQKQLIRAFWMDVYTANKLLYKTVMVFIWTRALLLSSKLESVTDVFKIFKTLIFQKHLWQLPLFGCSGPNLGHWRGNSLTRLILIHCALFRG